MNTTGQCGMSCTCPVCGGGCASVDFVDFNNSCMDEGARVFPRSGRLVEYVVCNECGHCFAPEICGWSIDEFSDRIYDEGYALVDPDFAVLRPSRNARDIISWFGERGRALAHLDYGGGHGLLSDFLRDSEWNSTSHDPFFDRGVRVDALGKFDLVTAYEVFEHVPDADRLGSDLATLLNPGGMVIFSTLLSDGFIAKGKPLTWSYAAPRNGHISLFSRKSLGLLARKHGFTFGSHAPGLHAFWRTKPQWDAAALFSVA